MNIMPSTILMILTVLFLCALLYIFLSAANSMRSRSLNKGQSSFWLKTIALFRDAGYEFEETKIKQLTIYFVCVTAFIGYNFAPIGAVIGSAFAVLGAYIFLTFQAKNYAIKSKQINDELCYSIARRLRSGESLIDAMRNVQPLFENSKLVSYINRYVDNGYSIENAITKTTSDHDIIENESEKMLCGTIALAHQMGGNSARIFERIGDCFHHTYELSSDTKAALAQVKMSAVFISLLPVGFLGISSMMGMSGTSFLFTEPIGLALLLGGMILQTLGILWMKKLVSRGVGIWNS